MTPWLRRIRVVAITLSMVVIALACDLSGSHATPSAPVAIVVHLDEHATWLRKQMRKIATEVVGGRQMTRGAWTLEGPPVVLARTKQGKIEVAATVSAILTRTSPRLLIHLAPAGALTDDLPIGSVVVSDRVSEHDLGTWQTMGGGESATFVPRRNEPIHLDRHWIERIRRHAETLEVPVTVGSIVTGEQFIRSEVKATDLHTTFEADAVDTSAAAVVRTAAAARVPALLLRVITDQAGTFSGDQFSASVRDDKLWTPVLELIDALITKMEHPT